MTKTTQRILRLLPLAACALGSGLFAHCGRMPHSLMLTATEPQAADHLMLVRAQPQTLGFRRLSYQSTLYPDLGSFLRFRGHPDFLAEANNDGRHYMVFYYLNDSRAFASRTLREDPHAITFAGPYPITPHEVRTLKTLADQSRGSLHREKSTRRSLSSPSQAHPLHTPRALLQKPPRKLLKLLA